MEVEFDTRFKHPFSMIVAGSSGSGKTVFTKQVLHSADVEFERIFWFYSEWQDGYQDCAGVKFVSGMPTSLDAYLESTGGPKLVVFDDMMTQCANSEVIAQAFTQKRHHHNVSVVLILQNLYCQGRVMRNVHLNTEYVVLFRNPRDKSQFGHFARQLEPKRSKDLVDASITVLSLAGRPQASHPRPAEIQERFTYVGPASRLRHWHGQLLKGGPRRGPPPPGARALPPPPLPLGLGGGGEGNDILLN